MNDMIQISGSAGNDVVMGDAALAGNSLAADEEYRALVRALRRKKGFGLFFVQARQGDRILEGLKRDLAGKSFARVQIEREDEALFDKLDAVWEQESVDVFWIDGLDRSLLGYEDVKRRAGWDEADLTDYSDRDVPPILSHLNMGRERFMRRFNCALVFVVPLFAVRYLLKRSSDFFDWGSGFFEFADSLEERQQFVQEVMESADYKAYEALSPVDRDEKIFRIEERLADPELDIEMQAKLWREIGRLFDSGKQHERAIVAFKKALKENPNYVDACRSLGSVYNDLGRYEEAVGALKRAIELDPIDVKVHHMLGNVYRSLNDYEKATVSYQKAIELNPEDANTYNNLGVTYSVQKRYEEAIGSYQKAIKLNPDFVPAYHNLGNTYAKLKRYEKAIGSYQKVIELNPKNLIVYNNLGSTYKAQNRYEESIMSYQKAIELNPDFFLAYHNLGSIYAELKRYEEAIGSYQKVIELNPEFIPTYYDLGIIYDAQKRYEEAIVTYQKAIELNSEDATAYNNLGSTYGNLKRYEEAIVTYQKAIELNPEDVTTYNNLGSTYGNLKRYEEAIVTYQKAIELNPKDATAYKNLGFLQYNVGDFHSSLLTFQKILDLQPDELSYLANISYLTLLQGDLDKAENLFEGIIDKNISDRAWLNYGLIQSQRGNLQEAMQSWKNGLNLMECDGEWDKAVHYVFTVALGNVHQGIEQMQNLINDGVEVFTLRNALNDATLILRSPHYPEGIEDIVQLLQTALSSMETI